CEVPIQPLMDEIQIPAGRGYKIPVFAQARDRTVVKNNAALIAHQGIAHAPRLQVGETMGVNLVEQFSAIGSADIKLAQRTDVNHTYCFANSAVFPRNAICLAGVSSSLIIPWTLPVSHVHPYGTVFVVRVVHRGTPDGMMLRARQCSQSYSRIRR